MRRGFCGPAFKLHSTAFSHLIELDVRSGSKSDIVTKFKNVRLAPRSGRKSEGEASKDSLISNQFSLFRSYKFPVRILAAIRQKWPVLRHFLMKTTVGQGSSSRISLYFSLLAGEFGTETGSRWTGSSANYFNYLG
jgi:hypothetical protein